MSKELKISIKVQVGQAVLEFYLFINSFLFTSLGRPFNAQHYSPMVYPDGHVLSKMQGRHLYLHDWHGEGSQKKRHKEKTKQNKTKQNKTKQKQKKNKTKQNKTKQNKKQNKKHDDCNPIKECGKTQAQKKNYKSRKDQAQPTHDTAHSLIQKTEMPCQSPPCKRK